MVKETERDNVTAIVWAVEEKDIDDIINLINWYWDGECINNPYKMVEHTAKALQAFLEFDYKQKFHLYITENEVRRNCDLFSEQHDIAILLQTK